jgi:hypothetical protein
MLPEGLPKGYPSLGVVWNWLWGISGSCPGGCNFWVQGELQSATLPRCLDSRHARKPCNRSAPRGQPVLATDVTDGEWPISSWRLGNQHGGAKVPSGGWSQGITVAECLTSLLSFLRDPRVTMVVSILKWLNDLEDLGYPHETIWNNFQSDEAPPFARAVPQVAVGAQFDAQENSASKSIHLGSQPQVPQPGRNSGCGMIQQFHWKGRIPLYPPVSSIKAS